ncbi:MAG TPA: MBL fold metallo-hydrolase [Pseudonocardiaceae bacterium]|jgi:L-ascorbate metabolism protein UlaG (beta-lactamase superfamily)|nr:MBL fold metallo-hydrolase [Pseudonocardiaceae bacterium]
MRIVHFGHACVLLETATARLLIDPGSFADGFEDLRDLTAILITHQHFDHFDEERVPALVRANPGAKLVVDPDSLPLTAKHGLDAQVAQAGQDLQLGGAAVTVVGGTHAEIYGKEIPGIGNSGYIVDHGAFYHPGDALFVPEQAIDVLGVPTAAPWLKTAEAIDFVKAVKPRVSVPIHEALLANPAFGYGWLESLTKDVTTFTVPPRGRFTEV